MHLVMQLCRGVGFQLCNSAGYANSLYNQKRIRIINYIKDIQYLSLG
jgi:hypothetical protein